MNLHIAGRFSHEAKELLARDFTVTHTLEEPPSPAELKETEVLIVRSRTQVNASLLNGAPKLKLVISATAGFDHLDFAELQRRKILATHTPLAHAQSAAELTFALLLALLRRLPENHAAMQIQKWDRQSLIGRELFGKTLGVVGYGRIGKKVAAMAQAFSLTVLAHDPFLSPSEFSGASAVEFEALLRQSDIVSLHVPLTEKTKGLMNTDAFSKLKPQAVLLNACRGKVVDEKALLKWLHDNPQAGAALDVFESEPLESSSPLLAHPRVVLSAHVGALTHEAFNRASLEAAQKAVAFKKQQQISDLLPPNAAWWPISQ